MELCQIGANQGFTAQTDWDYTSPSRRCRKIVIGSVVRAVKSHSSGKKPNFDPKPQKSRNDSSYQFIEILQVSVFGKVLLFFDISSILYMR